MFFFLPSELFEGDVEQAEQRQAGVTHQLIGALAALTYLPLNPESGLSGKRKVIKIYIHVLQQPQKIYTKILKSLLEKRSNMVDVSVMKKYF